MNDEQLAEIREGNLNCVRLHLWLRQKQQLLQRKVYKLIASNFIVLETFCRSINH